MDEEMKDAAVPDKNNEEYVEAEVLFDKNINAPGDLYEEASADPKSNKDQDSVATTDLVVHEDLDVDSSLLPEVTEYNELPVAGARDEENTHKTSDYDTEIDIDLANTVKNEKNT